MMPKKLRGKLASKLLAKFQASTFFFLPTQASKSSSLQADGRNMHTVRWRKSYILVDHSKYICSSCLIYLISLNAGRLCIGVMNTDGIKRRESWGKRRRRRYSTRGATVPRVLFTERRRLGLGRWERRPRGFAHGRQERRDFLLISCLIRLIHLLSLYREVYLTPKQATNEP